MSAKRTRKNVQAKDLNSFVQVLKLVSSSWDHLALFGFDPVYNEFIDVYLKELLAQT